MVAELYAPVTAEQIADPSSRRPRPTAARDSGDRVYELDAAEIDDNERNVLDAAAYEYGHAEIERAHAEQAVLGAQATLVDDYRAAMADVTERFAGWYVHGLYSMPFGTFGPAAWNVIVSRDGVQHCGLGETVREAVEDLLAVVASGRAA